MRISDWSSDVCSSDLSLRYLTQAGGAMAPALTRRVPAAFTQARLFVMYGQTEASARLTRLTPERLDDKIGSVVTPIGGVEIRVRRVDGSDASAGAAGQVCARSAHVINGYCNGTETRSKEVRVGEECGTPW